MVKPQTNIDLHDLIIVFNDIIAKHIANINDKRDEINRLRTEIDTKYALVGDNNTDTNAAAVIYKDELVKAEKRVKELEIALSNSGYSSEDSRQAFEWDEYEKINDIHPPEPTPAELMSYCEDRIQEFIRNDLFEAKSINHIIDIRFIPKSFTMYNESNNELFYYYNDVNDDPINQGYYCSYKGGVKLLNGELQHEPLTKEQFTNAYLRAEVNNALKKPQKGRDIRRIPKHEDKLLFSNLYNYNVVTIRRMCFS